MAAKIPRPTTNPNPRHLTLDDIVDQRAYERVRPELRADMIDLKARRRLSVGTVISLMFENRETIRYQVHEMARVEKHTTDEAIETELAAYNPLIPYPGHLSATLFIECTTDEQMKEWFPKLTGIERSLEFRIGEGTQGLVFRSTPDEDHDAQLTREDITSAVHYVRFEIGTEHAEAFLAGPVSFAITHPHYLEVVELSDGMRRELSTDIRL
jgi:Protein of unknown function (DUF3501)